MSHWITTAFSTYILHPLHANGYQWWSGAGSDLTYLALLTALWHRHNCHEPWCFRIVRHGHTHCPRHAR